MDRRARAFLSKAEANKETAKLLSRHRLARIECGATLEDVRKCIGTSRE